MSLRNEGRAPTTVNTLVDLNAVGDTPVNVPFAKYIVRTMTLYDASTSLGASAATIGSYTGAGATGTAIVTPVTAAGLTSATKFTDRTIAAGTDYLTARTVYIRVGVVHGSAATCSVAFEFECLE